MNLLAVLFVHVEGGSARRHLRDIFAASARECAERPSMAPQPRS
jgi:hypothetical protein